MTYIKLSFPHQCVGLLGIMQARRLRSQEIVLRHTYYV